MSNECENGFISVLMGGTLQQLSPVVQTVLIFLIIINILAFPLTAFLNALVMIAVKRKSRLRANKSNVVLALTATTDVTVGIIAQPAFILFMIKYLIDGTTSLKSCPLLFFRIAVSSLCDASLLHLVLISGERYLAMKHSFAYTKIVTETRLLVASGCAWILSFLLHIPPLISNAFGINLLIFVTNNILIGICLAFIAFCHVTVYREIRRHKKQIAAQQATPEAREQLLKDQKALKLTSIIVAVLLICFMPTFVLRIILATSASSTSSVETVYLSSLFTTTVMLLNSLLNPLVYSLRMRQFRIAFIELLTCGTANVAEDEEIEMRMFGPPNAVVPLDSEQLDGLKQLQNTVPASRNTAINNSNVPAQHENHVFNQLTNNWVTTAHPQCGHSI